MYAVFLRIYKDDVVPLCECMLFKEESEAQWFCILNHEYTYRKIEG